MFERLWEVLGVVASSRGNRVARRRSTVVLGVEAMDERLTPSGLGGREHLGLLVHHGEAEHHRGAGERRHGPDRREAEGERGQGRHRRRRRGQVETGQDVQPAPRQAADDRGQHVEPGDDHGGATEPGDDRGRSGHPEPGDDHGGQRRGRR